MVADPSTQGRANARERRSHPPRALVAEAAWLFVVLRIGLSVLAVFVAMQGPPSPCHYEVAFNGWRTIPELVADGPAFPLVGIWERWDACWYMKIATYGYEPGEGSVAFFALFPTLVSVVGAIPFVNLPLAGLVVSGAAYVAAIVGLLRLVGRDFGTGVARRTVLFLSVFPGAFFLFAPFTEALFLALVAWTLERARRRDWALAAVLGFAAGLTRAPGMLLALPIAWELLTAVRSETEGRRRWPIVGGIAAVAAPVVAFLAFGAVAAAATGMSPYDAQAIWGGSQFHPPWEVVAASVTWAVERSDPMQALNVASLVGAAVLLLLGIRRLPITYSAYAWPALLLAGMRLQPTPLTSTTRLVLVLFPVFVVLALLTPSRRARDAVLIGSVLLLGVLTFLFLRGDFVA